jgi:hypothetical protein
MNVEQIFDVEHSATIKIDSFAHLDCQGVAAPFADVFAASHPTSLIHSTHKILCKLGDVNSRAHTSRLDDVIPAIHVRRGKQSND